MHVQGVSTRRAQKITEELSWLEVSSSEVSRAAELLDEELAARRSRPIGEMAYVTLDAKYEKARHGGFTVDSAVLLAAGVRADDGRWTVLGSRVSLSEAEVHWPEFLASLQERGLHGVRVVTSNDRKGLRAGLAARGSLAAVSVPPPAEHSGVRTEGVDASRSRAGSEGHVQRA